MELACWSRVAWAALLLAVPRSAPARSPSGAESCAAPQAEIRDPQPGADAPPSVDTVISGAPGHWDATLRVHYENGSQGTRRISARNCAELQRAVTVTLSLLNGAEPVPESESGASASLEAESAARAVPRADLPRAARASGALSSPALSPAAPAPPARSSSAAPAPAPAASRRSAAPDSGAPRIDQGGVADPLEPAAHPLDAFLRVSSLLAIAGGRFGELGAALGGGMWFGSVGARVELSGRRPLSRVPAEHGVSLQLERYTAALEPCARVRRAIQWALCGGPRLELLRGLASGPSDPASDVVWLPGVGAGSALLLPLSASWALSAELQASWSLRRAQASVAPWGKVYELPATASSLLLGAEWAL